jgi:uncharacterized protein YqeY
MLEDQISKDYITAMKARDTIKSSTLSFLRAQMKNVVIEKRVDKLEDQDVIAVIKKQVKQRQDSIAQYQQGGRQDLVDKEAAELAVLKGYLPQEISPEEIERLVVEAIKDAGAASMKDMGKVMKVMTEKVKGQADNKLVSELVKKALSQL